MNRLQQFGLYLAGIGALLVAFELLFKTLDYASFFASTILIIVGVLVYAFVGWRSSVSAKGQNLSGINAQRASDKEERKTHILSLFDGKDEITNNDVEELLGVSDATATNYLSELEEAGEIKQMGETGRNVSYKRVR